MVSRSMVYRTTDGAESFGPVLIRLRQRLGLSQQRLADRLCVAAGLDTVGRHEISRWEREERVPTEFWLPWLSEILGVAVDDLRRAGAITRRHRPGGRSDARIGTRVDAGDLDNTPWRVIELHRVRYPGGAIVLRAVPGRPVIG